MAVEFQPRLGTSGSVGTARLLEKEGPGVTIALDPAAVSKEPVKSVFEKLARVHAWVGRVTEDPRALPVSDEEADEAAYPVTLMKQVDALRASLPGGGEVDDTP